MLGEELVDAHIECGVELAERGDLGIRDARAPLETFANVRLDEVEMTGVQARGFPGLDGREDRSGVGPPIGMNGAAFEAEGSQFLNDGVEAVDDFRFAIVEEGVRDGGEAREHGLRRAGCGSEGCGEQERIFEIAKEPAHGVKRFTEVYATSPVAAADGGTIAGESGERGGHAHRATGVCTDGRDGGAFKDAGDGAA